MWRINRRHTACTYSRTGYTHIQIYAHTYVHERFTRTWSNHHHTHWCKYVYIACAPRTYTKSHICIHTHTYTSRIYIHAYMHVYIPHKANAEVLTHDCIYTSYKHNTLIHTHKTYIYTDIHGLNYKSVIINRYAHTLTDIYATTYARINTWKNVHIISYIEFHTHMQAYTHERNELWKNLTLIMFITAQMFQMSLRTGSFTSSS